MAIDAAPERLSSSQQRVVRLLSLGCTVAEAAAILGISVSTADNHKAAAMRILGVHKMAMLTRFAIASGISPLGDELTEAERRTAAGVA